MFKSPRHILYTAHVIAIGGRIGTARSDDGMLDVMLHTPHELGGTGCGTNPEQLLAACYAVAFIAAIKIVARRGGVDGAVSLWEISIECDVGIGPAEDGLAVRIDMRITIPGVDKVSARALIEAARQVCPYTNALGGNVQIDVSII